jgi:hypothetical protein
MRVEKRFFKLAALCFLVCSACVAADAQKVRSQRAEDREFGPNVRAYLLYLRDEQEVVDDRASRREIKHSYYVHNSNRIHALRQMAIRIARTSGNDYMPELEAVSASELTQLFDGPPPKPEAVQVGEILEYKLKYLGTEASGGEKFYLFARLDPYEQAELRKKAKAEAGTQTGTHTSNTQPTAADTNTRPRRVSSP